MFLGRSIGYEPSAAYLQTKARILKMPFPIRPPISRSIEIPVSIQMQLRSKDYQTAMFLTELRELVDGMILRSHQLEADNTEVESRLDCASTFSYRIIELRLYLTDFRLTSECGESLLAVPGAGVPFAVLEMGLGTGDSDEMTHREAFAKFLNGALIRPQEQVSSISTLEISINGHGRRRRFTQFLPSHKLR